MIPYGKCSVNGFHDLYKLIVIWPDEGWSIFQLPESDLLRNFAQN